MEQQNEGTSTEKQLQKVSFTDIRNQFIENFNDTKSYANIDQAIKAITDFPKLAMINTVIVESVNPIFSNSSIINNYVAFDVKLSLVDKITTTWDVPGYEQTFTLTTYVDNRHLINEKDYEKNLNEYITKEQDFFKSPLEAKKHILKYNKSRTSDTLITNIVPEEKISVESDKVYKQKYELTIIAMDGYKWASDTSMIKISVVVQIDSRDYVDSEEVYNNLQKSVAETFNSVANAQQAIENSAKALGVKNIKSVYEGESKTIYGDVIFAVTVSIEDDYKWKDGKTEDKTYKITASIDERTVISLANIESSLNIFVKSKGHLSSSEEVISVIKKFEYSGIKNIRAEVSKIHQRELTANTFKITFDLDFDYKLNDNEEPTFYSTFSYAQLIDLKNAEAELISNLKLKEFYETPEEVIEQIQLTSITGVKQIEVKEVSNSKSVINATFKVQLTADEGYLFSDMKNIAEIEVNQNYAKIINTADVQAKLQDHLNQLNFEREVDIINEIETRFVYQGLENFKVTNSRSAVAKSLTVTFDTTAGYQMNKNNLKEITVEKEYAVILEIAKIKADLDNYLSGFQFETSNAIVNKIETEFKYTGIKKFTVIESTSSINKQFLVTIETETGYTTEKGSENKFVIEKEYAILLETSKIETSLKDYLANKSYETAEQIVAAIETEFKYKGIENLKATYSKAAVTKTFAVTFDTANGYALLKGNLNSFTVDKSYVKRIGTDTVSNSVKSKIGEQSFKGRSIFFDFLMKIDDPMYKITDIKINEESETNFEIVFETKPGFELLSNQKNSFQIATNINYEYKDIQTTDVKNDFSVSYNNQLYIFSNEDGKTVIHTYNSNREYKEIGTLSETTNIAKVYNNKIYIGAANGKVYSMDKDNEIKALDQGTSNNKIVSMQIFNNKLYFLSLNRKAYTIDSTNKVQEKSWGGSYTRTIYNMLATEDAIWFNTINTDTYPMFYEDKNNSPNTGTIRNITSQNFGSIRKQFAVSETFKDVTFYSTGIGNDGVRSIVNGASSAKEVSNSPIINKINVPATKFVQLGNNLFFSTENSANIYQIKGDALSKVQSATFAVNKNFNSFENVMGELYFIGDNYIGIRDSNITLKI
ncbi:hypothetical protein [Mesoplasma syrphidae]|nr:hypothetical protein [Mesoplasma syrphidae]